MSGGGFIFKTRKSVGGGAGRFEIVLRLWDRLNGDFIEESAPLKKILTITGEVFSLRHSLTQPWFDCLDGYGPFLGGHLHNCLTVSPDAFFSTDEIICVEDSNGKVFPTTLALLPDPYNGGYSHYRPPQNVLSDLNRSKRSYPPYNRKTPENG
jgi:hypothetical protein